VRIGEPDAIGAANTQAFVFAILGRTAPELPIPTSTFGRRVDPVLIAFHQHATASGGRPRRPWRVTVSPTPRTRTTRTVVLAAVMLAEYGTDDERRQVYEHLLPLAGTHSVVGGCASYQGAVDHHWRCWPPRWAGRRRHRTRRRRDRHVRAARRAPLGGAAA
jgi:hypothetical protein